MSDRVEERRTEQIIDQKKLENQKTKQEQEASAAKFKSVVAGKLVAQKASESTTKDKQQKQGQEGAQGQKKDTNAFMARQGITNRTSAERLMKQRDEGSKVDRDREKAKVDEKDRESELRDGVSRDENRDDAKGLEKPVARKDERDQKQDQQNPQPGNQSGQNPQGGMGHGQGGQQRQDQQQDKNDLHVAAASKAKTGGVGAASEGGETKSATKLAIGKSDKAAAAERIAPKVLEGIVEKVWSSSQQGMSEFQIQLKDDALGGGALRVTLKDGKLKLAFTMKDASAKNLLESSKGVLMRMFERKGLRLETLEVKVRGDGP